MSPSPVDPYSTLLVLWWHIWMLLCLNTYQLRLSEYFFLLLRLVVSEYKSDTFIPRRYRWLSTISLIYGKARRIIMWGNLVCLIKALSPLKLGCLHSLYSLYLNSCLLTFNLCQLVKTIQFCVAALLISLLIESKRRWWNTSLLSLIMWLSSI